MSYSSFFTYICDSNISFESQILLYSQMKKYLYLIGALTFALGLSACKKDAPQTSTEKTSSTTTIPASLTRQAWTVVAPSSDASAEGPTLRYDFRPDGTYDLTYAVSSGARSLATARALNVVLYHFSGMYSYQPDGTIHVHTVAFVRVEGQTTASEREQLISQIVESLTDRSYRYNSYALQLTFVEKPTDSASGQLPSIFRQPLAPSAQQPDPSTSPQPSSPAPQALLDARWVLDESVLYNGRDYRGLEFNADGTYRLHWQDIEFEPRKRGMQAGADNQDYYIQGTYRYFQDTIQLLSARFAGYGDYSSLQLDAEERARISEEYKTVKFAFSSSQGTLVGIDTVRNNTPQGLELSVVKMNFTKAPRTFSLTSGSWTFDVLTPNKKAGSSFIDGTIRTFTFKADGTYTLHHLFESFNENKDNLAREYNDGYTIEGRYSYQAGKVTLLSSRFVGYDARFQSVRPVVTPEDYGEAPTGMVFRVDEKLRTMRLSIADSYGPAKASLAGESQDEEPYFFQLFSSESW